MAAALIAMGVNSHLNSYSSSKNESPLGRRGGNALWLLGIEIQLIHTKHGK